MTGPDPAAAPGAIGARGAGTLDVEGELGECVELLVASLLPADSPWLAGEDPHHTQMLADSESTLPAILVHRATMQVIDGMHRLNAAILRGEKTIRAPR